jgi:hypothetical protein
MFNKIIAKINKIIIVFNFFNQVTKFKGDKYSEKSTNVFQKLVERANDYIEHDKETYDFKTECDGDDTGKEYPIWIETIEDSDFFLLGRYIPTMYNLGVITPIVSPVVNTETNELKGFLIVVPKSYRQEKDLERFTIGHEFGHIANGDFIGVDVTKKQVVTSDEIESLADMASSYAGNIPMEQCSKLVYRLFEKAYKTTIKNIPALSKRWDDVKIEKIVTNILRYEKIMHIRMDVLELMSEKDD